ncbi:hypothetical protein [Paenarthrobacter sp. CAP02]|uniref:hypothetical protein n=1 Tax=Paenarthrobacter sp. CAP02 TaxID=3158144 RepID=UPI0032DA73BD
MNAGEESSFSDAEEKPQDVDAGCARREPDEHGDDPPTDHDPRDPDPGSHSMQQDITGNFKQHVAQKENTDGKSECGGIHVEFLTKPLTGERNAGPVEVSNDVPQHQYRHQSPEYFALCSDGNIGQSVIYFSDQEFLLWRLAAWPYRCGA